MEPENKADQSKAIRSGVLDDLRGAKPEDDSEKPADAADVGTTSGSAKTASNEADIVRPRGTKEDFVRSFESKPTQPGGAATSESAGNDSAKGAGGVTLRDGTRQG